MSARSNRCKARGKAAADAAAKKLNKSQKRKRAVNALNQKTIDELYDELDSAGNALEAARGKVGQTRRAAMIEKKNRIQNVIVFRGIMDETKAAFEKTGDPTLAIRAALGGVNTPLFGAQWSVDAISRGMTTRLMGGAWNDLQKARVEVGGRKVDLMRRFGRLTKDDERKLARVLWDMSLDDPQGVTAPADIMGIAKIMHKWREIWRGELNARNANIEKHEGYIGRQNHDTIKMAAAGRADWKAAVRDKLDYARMEVEVGDIDKFLDSAYWAITSGVRLSENRPLEDIASAWTGPGNLAKRVSSARVLIFKDADMWMDYREQFSSSSLHNAFASDMLNASRNVGLLTRLGTNPKAMVDRLMQAIGEEYRSDFDAMAKINNQKNHINNLIAEVDGTTALGSETTKARWGQTIRGLKNMAILGSSVISTLTDWVNVANTRRYHGDGMSKATMEGLLSLPKGIGRRALGSPELKEALRQSGVGAKAVWGGFYNRFDASDDSRGYMSWLTDKFFKANLMSYQADFQREAAFMLHATKLGAMAGKGFDDLDDATKRLLGLYNISAKEWDIARLAMTKDVDGDTFIFPGEIDNVSGAVFRGMSKAQQARAKRDVRLKLFSMYATEVSHSIPEPGARENAIMKQGLQEGTWAGQGLRFLMQLKAFPITIATKGWGRALHGQSLEKRSFLQTAVNYQTVNLIIGAGITGMFVNWINDLKAGREPRELSWKSFVAGLLKGGGAGIYGDFLFAETNRYGTGALDTLAGPVLGTAAEIINLWNLGRQGEARWGDVLQLVKSNIPFANIFYVKPVLDYMIWYQLQEAINPGYLKRQERRLQRRDGTEYWLAPSNVVARGGGFR